MPESPTETISRAAKAMAADVQGGFVAALVELFECIADDVRGAEAFECGPMGLVSSEFEGSRPEWTAALKAARTYLGDQQGGVARA